MQNQAMLLVSDMGLEIPVPDIQWGNNPDMYSAVMTEIDRVDYVGNPTTQEISKFKLRKLSDGNYELDKYEFLREALEFMYKYEKPEMLQFQKDLLHWGIPLDNARLIKYEMSMSHDSLRELSLKLYI